VSDIPQLVRRAPLIFYLAGAIYFVVALGLLSLQLGTMTAALDGAPPAAGEAFAANVRGTVRLAMIAGLLQAAYGALLLAGVGVISRILLAIWSSRSVSSVFEAPGASREDTH